MAELSRGGTSLEGKVLHGHYLLEKMTAKGGMAWLYKARHLRLEEPVAVKVLYPHLSEEEHIRSRFRDEARIQFRLKHAHIVQVLDLVDDSGLYGMVMEWVDGIDLSGYLKQQRSPLRLERIWALLQPILQATHYAHEQGVVHRDIKPQNILLHTQEGKEVPKLCDFGIAKMRNTLAGHKTRTGSVLGTPSYMAPEQVTGAKDVDQRADIYSLGMMLYRMTTGQVAFRGSPHQITYKQIQERPQPPSQLNPSIDRGLEAVILRCIEKDPVARYADCNALSLALARVLSSQTERDQRPVSVDVQLVGGLLHEDDEPTMNTPIFGQGLSGETASGHLPTHEQTPSPGSRPTQLPAKPRHGPAVAIGVGLASLLVFGGLLSFWFSRSRPVQPRQAVALGAAAPQMCYTGPSGTQSIGICKPGTRRCRGGKCGPCVGQVLPQKESCNGKDDDCNGDVDDEITARSCQNACGPGRSVCTQGTWSLCQTQHKAELCNGKDDNCDGKVDEGFEKKGKPCLTSSGGCRMRGVWRCGPAGQRLRCRQGRPAPRPGHRQIRLRLLPSRSSFSLRFGGTSLRARRSTCIEVKSRVRIQVKARGFQTCRFTLRPTRRRLSIRMNPLTQLMASKPSYCVR